MPLKKKTDYNTYMRKYMTDFRKKERQYIHEYKLMKGIPNGRKKPKEKRK